MIPNDAVRGGIAQMVGLQLGFEGLELLPMPKVEDIELPACALSPPASLPFVTDDSTERMCHTYGRAYPDIVRGFYGAFDPAPDLVAHPKTESDVEATLAWAATEGVAVVPFGGGTSVVRGVEPDVGPTFAGSLSLDMREMNRVLEVDSHSRAARIQAGATGPQIEAQLKEHGLTLRHFPQSFEFSTLGGWVATRAGGHFATLYTHIDDLVESIRMVTPTGLMASRRLPGSGAGPSPDRLMLGSEGTLGVITEAWMRLQDRPKWRIGGSFHFNVFEAGVEAARLLSQSGLHPANCRLLDSAEAALNSVTDDGSCVLIVAFESADHPMDPWMERAKAICVGLGGTCPRGITRRGPGETGSDAAESWKRAFVDAPYLQSTLVSLGVMADTFETACTWDAFEALYANVSAAVGQALDEVCGGGKLTCRFTHVYPDGPAPYFTFLGRAQPGRELEQWKRVKSAASEALLASNGTITHHHAVGRSHRPWYDRQRPEPFGRVLSAVKGALDPAGILNPGVLIDAQRDPQ